MLEAAVDPGVDLDDYPGVSATSAAAYRTLRSAQKAAAALPCYMHARLDRPHPPYHWHQQGPAWIARPEGWSGVDEEIAPDCSLDITEFNVQP